MRIKNIQTTGRFEMIIIMALVMIKGTVCFAGELEAPLRGKDPVAAEAIILQKDPQESESSLRSDGQDLHGTKQEELQGQLAVAIGYNDVVAVTRLLAKGAKADQPLDSSGITPLMIAESIKIAKLLIASGADPKAISASGSNLLHFAVTKQSALELLSLFASLGADANARDKENNTPLSLAVIYFYETGAYQTAPVLVGKDSIPGSSKPEKTGPTPREVLQALVAAGADLNSVDDYGNTVLMDSVVWDEPELAEILLALGADRTIRNKGGQTARDTAYEMGRRYIYQLLQ